MQPTFRQVPPSDSRDSTQAVLRPFWAARIAVISSHPDVRAEIESRLDLWLDLVNRKGGSHLGYDVARTGVTVPLLTRPGLAQWGEFTCLMSLRDVEPSVALLIAPRALDAPPPERASGKEVLQ